MARIRRQAAEWGAPIDQWRQSGLSLPAFCQRHGLSRGSMQNWVYKPELKRAVEAARREAQGPVDEPAASAMPAFLPVKVVQAAAVSEAVIVSVVEDKASRTIAVGTSFERVQHVVMTRRRERIDGAVVGRAAIIGRADDVAVDETQSTRPQPFGK